MKFRGIEEETKEYNIIQKEEFKEDIVIFIGKKQIKLSEVDRRRFNRSNDNSCTIVSPYMVDRTGKRESSIPYVMLEQ
ncbi:MAG: hypothetical protein EZS28_015203 [Streblomastix strix]|uniref:Uncharacterized protein n=1 Tax=Streblomastix strix TaxID=222440 RepID=A0A5J4W3N0_9EUKA|nr:MAG: hypothetical protein EZS28_015203 [Streblomastix strix]